MLMRRGWGENRELTVGYTVVSVGGNQVRWLVSTMGRTEGFDRGVTRADLGFRSFSVMCRKQGWKRRLVQGCAGGVQLERVVVRVRVVAVELVRVDWSQYTI